MSRYVYVYACIFVCAYVYIYHLGMAKDMIEETCRISDDITQVSLFMKSSPSDSYACYFGKATHFEVLVEEETFDRGRHCDFLQYKGK